MAASSLPMYLVPLTGLIFPAIVFAFSLLYIESNDIG